MPEHALCPPHSRAPWIRGNEHIDVMAGLAAAASAITTIGIGSEPTGAAVASAMSVSYGPPVIAVTLGLRSPTLAGIRATRVFAVNVLRLPVQEIAQLFGTQPPDAPDSIPWQLTASGTPWLPTLSLKAVECSLVSEIPVGDQALLLGAVTQIHSPAQAPAP